MQVLARSLLGVLLVACAGGDDSSAGNAANAPALSGSPDAGTFTFSYDAATEAGSLLTPCDPANRTSCSTGFTCFTQHTSTSWWVDLYGTCTFDCNSQTYALCDSLGGVCGCPVAQGATTSDCSLDAGVALVCVPGLKPGTSPGASEGDGGCGTPGCGGGSAFEAGALPGDAAQE